MRLRIGIENGYEATPNPTLSSPIMVSTEGKVIEIPQELFDALVEFSKTGRIGEIRLNMKSGGISGVVMECRLK